jgi:hypothetical protein
MKLKQIKKIQKCYDNKKLNFSKKMDWGNLDK